MTSKASTKLSQFAWQEAGFKALTEAGPDALKAETLARRLGTTKGSFYWHFADVPAFHAALLAAWEERAVSEIVAALADENTPVGQLRRAAQFITDKDTGAALEPAIRAWARGSIAAAKTVERVDDKRLAYLRELLNEAGIGNPEMARIIYAASIGMEDLGEDTSGENAATIGSLVDLILALR